MNSLTSAIYVVFGLLIITLTNFENYNGPKFIMLLEVILFLYSILNPYLHKIYAVHQEYWKEDTKK